MQRDPDRVATVYSLTQRQHFTAGLRSNGERRGALTFGSNNVGRHGVRRVAAHQSETPESHKHAH